MARSNCDIGIDDDLVARVLGVDPVTSGCHHRHGATLVVPDLGGSCPHVDLGAGRFDLLLAHLPHLARSVLRVLELLDEAGDVGGLALGQNRDLPREFVDDGVHARIEE